ncbi:MAG: DUF6092 family protein [Chloroflexota bacterium]|nr:DUF6092 family protein [Chloroflexota bacterium]MDE2949669.1 DUF6092 family protein [Chloroflexota bacterium]
MSENWVLTEAEAVELLALLITSARIQMDEPAHYGPLRLLTATERLSAMMLERSSDKSKAFLQDNIERIPEMHMAMSDVETYKSALDQLCREVAGCLLRHSELEGASP